MEIELQKDPFEYRQFWYVVKYDNVLSNADAEILIRTKICRELTKKTNMRWNIRSCVGGKCTIATSMVLNRKLRKKWKGKIIDVGDIKYLK